MLDVKKIREDFPLLTKKNIMYFDNSATTLKPQCVLDAVMSYYTDKSVNVHRGDYQLSFDVSKEYEETRQVVASFINCQSKEVVFTSGATESLNIVAYGVGKKFINKGDVILTTVSEHASNVLPWFRVAKEKEAIIEYIPLTASGEITIENFEKAMHSNVKVVAIANVSNVLGFIQPIEEISKIAHRFGAIVVCDGAQSVPHIVCDVKKWDVDFLAFSFHKMCGPTGVGILYGKYELLQQLEPLKLGGGSNARFDVCGNVLLKEAPFKFESGTPPIEAILGSCAAIKYVQSIGMNLIEQYEHYLRTILITELKKLDNVILYNEDATSGIIPFNIKGVFAQDAGSYLNSKNIAVRSGNHCAKLLTQLIGVNETVRCSLYFYNTVEEVMAFAKACSEITVESCIGLFFESGETI